MTVFIFPKDCQTCFNKHTEQLHMLQQTLFHVNFTDGLCSLNKIKRVTAKLVSKMSKQKKSHDLHCQTCCFIPGDTKEFMAQTSVDLV